MKNEHSPPPQASPHAVAGVFCRPRCNSRVSTSESPPFLLMHLSPNLSRLCKKRSRTGSSPLDLLFRVIMVVFVIAPSSPVHSPKSGRRVFKENLRRPLKCLRIRKELARKAG